MRRTTIFLDERAERELKALAVRRGETMAALIREAIAQYLVHAIGEVRLPSFVGAGRSGRPDIAERHEELLCAFAPHETVPRRRNSAADRRPRRR